MVAKFPRTVCRAHAALRHARRARRSAAGDNPGMEIKLNGDTLAIADNTTVQDLLEQQGLGGRRVAVEVNGAIVPRSRHLDHRLHDGDHIEIVHALGGG